MSRTIVSPGLFFALALSLVWAAAGRAENWPHWRGPANDGVSQETNIPTTWSATKNLAWKLPLPGQGSSTPVLWGNRLFLTCAEGDDLVLLCVGTDGKQLWKQKVDAGNKAWRGDEGNNASASPSTDGKHVYVFFGSGALASYDFEGKQIWKFNVQDRYGKIHIQHGLHTSPVLDGDRLYLQLLHQTGQWVIALDKATGKEVWKVNRSSDGRDECKDSYVSPSIWRKGKEAYLITHGNDYAIAHRLSDGSEIWRLGDINPKGNYNSTLRLVASPLATPDLIVVPSAKNGPVIGLKPDARGIIRAGSEFELWRMPRGTPDVPSPLVHDGLVYLCRENGVLICLDAKTGKELYNQRTHPQRYRASPVYADGKIYITARDGTTTVVKAGPKYQALATNRLPDEVTASPIIAYGRIYIRGFKALYAIGPAGK